MPEGSDEKFQEFRKNYDILCIYGFILLFIW